MCKYWVYLKYGKKYTFRGLIQNLKMKLFNVYIKFVTIVNYIVQRGIND